MLGIPEDVERENEFEGLLNEIITENFHNVEIERDIQVQEIHRTPNRQDQKRPSPRHIVTKLTSVKHKEQILKCEGEK